PPLSTPFPYTTLFRSLFPPVLIISCLKKQKQPGQCGLLLQSHMKLLKGNLLSLHEKTQPIRAGGYRCGCAAFSLHIILTVPIVTDRKSTRLNSSHVSI